MVHPGWEPIYGREAVLESWRRILKTPESPGSQEPIASQVLVNDPVGTVVCFEKSKVIFLIATNLFVKRQDDGGCFYMRPRQMLSPLRERAACFYQLKINHQLHSYADQLETASCRRSIAKSWPLGLRLIA